VPGYQGPSSAHGYAADAVAVTDLCAGGTNDGRSCTSNANCPGGGVCSGVVVFARPEAEEPTGGTFCLLTDATGCDLNGDGDHTDRVLHIYRQSDGSVVNTGQEVEEFVVK